MTVFCYEEEVERMLLEKIRIKTDSKICFFDITGRIRETILKETIKDGILTVYVPHTTAGVIINESADPDVVRDIGMWLTRVVPEDLPYRHMEGNSPAHIKSIITGNSVQIGIERGELVLGTWQGVFFCEFDGPRTREILLLI